MPQLTPRRALAALALLATAAAASYFGALPQGATGPAEEPGAEAVMAAYAARRSDQWLEAGGVVARILADDEDGSRHQRFILLLDGTHSVLVAHNIDLAPRVPLARGDQLTLRGEYEWNEKGGVIHWTHHDPAGRRGGGWIRHRGKTYR